MGHTVNKTPPLSERQPSLQKQGMGEHASVRRDASERYSATEQRTDKAKLDLAANNAPRNLAGPAVTGPNEITQQDERLKRSSEEDAQVQDAEANRRS